MKLITITAESDRINCEFVKAVKEGSAKQLLVDMALNHFDIIFDEDTTPAVMLNKIKNAIDEDGDNEIIGLIAVLDNNRVEVWL